MATKNFILGIYANVIPDPQKKNNNNNFNKLYGFCFKKMVKK